MAKTAKRRMHDALRHDVPMRPWTVLAQDPGLRDEHGVVTTEVWVPAERLERGPKGHRMHVIDYDGSADLFYRARDIEIDHDPYEDVHDAKRLVADCYFHQQNVYAIAMSTLNEFECALGRPVPWGFDDPCQQLKIAPHAYADANAGYSRESESLGFGYFPDDSGRLVFTCLSHDVIVHETTHALLDGLRPFYMKPSSTDQAGFHEGFADVVALLSVFRAPEVVRQALRPLIGKDGRIRTKRLTLDELAATALGTLAEEMGQAMEGVPTAALRSSLKIEPDQAHYTSTRFEEEHDRGELLVAILMRAFMETWLRRLAGFLDPKLTFIRPQLVVEEGCNAAAQLLRVVIRAIDYLPPVDMTFPDYVSALLTADIQLNPNDTKYGYRGILLTTFQQYGIDPASHGRSDGAWEPPPNAASLSMAGVHLERLQREPTEVFRFVWENRVALGIDADAFTRVTSVHPAIRVGNDWAILRETVAQYVQTLRVRADELSRLDIDRPPDLDDDREIVLHGGGTLIFDEFGRLKFHIGTGVRSSKQSERLRSLWARGQLSEALDTSSLISRMHRDRVLRLAPSPSGVW